MLMDGAPMGDWPEGGQRTSKIVFIGRDLRVDAPARGGLMLAR